MAKNIIIGITVMLLALFILAFIFARIEYRRVLSAFNLYARETERRTERLKEHAAESGQLIGQLRGELDEERRIRNRVEEINRGMAAEDRKQREIHRQLRAENQKYREGIERAERLNEAAIRYARKINKTQ